MGGNVNFAKTSFISLKIKVDEDGKFLIFCPFCVFTKESVNIKIYFVCLKIMMLNIKGYINTAYVVVVFLWSS